MFNSLQPHEPQHARPPCPSPTPRVHPKPCPSSQWCYPTISSSVIPFSSCPQSFPASGSFQMSQLLLLVKDRYLGSYCYLHNHCGGGTHITAEQSGMFWLTLVPLWNCILGSGHGNPLQHSCLENPMDRGPWQATIHGISRSQTWLSD